MANGDEATQDKVASKGGQGRGPSYPALDLQDAVEKAVKFWAEEKRSSAPVTAAARHWGYSETSSSGKMAVAALIQYGLMEDQGAGEKRTVKLTGRALDIVLDEISSPKRIKALQAAVTQPKIYSEILSKWPAHELPSDHTLRYFLVREKAYNEGAVAGLIKDFRASIAYAKLDKPGTIPDSEQATQRENPADAQDDKVPPEVGDLIQWESSGVLRLDAPRRVRAKQQHEGAWWVFVERSETGIPMDEAVVVERKQDPAGKTAKNPPVLPMQSQEEQSAELVQGEREWLRGKLSKQGTSYRLIVSGELGSKEIGKLIKLLEAQKLVLEDEDDHEDD